MYQTRKKFLLLTAFVSVIFSFLSVSAQSVNKYYRLVQGGKSVFVTNASLNANEKLVMWTETNVPAQRWLMLRNDDGTYSFRNVYSGYSIAYNIINAPGTNIAQRDGESAGNWAKWKLTPVEGKASTYIITTATNEKNCISAIDTADGDAIKLADVSTTSSDKIEWMLEEDDNVSSAFNEAVRDSMMNGFLNQYYHPASTGYVLGGGGWWGDAEMFETVLDAFETTGDKRYETIFSNLYINFLMRNGTDWTGNQYNDDITWMVLACIRAYKYFGVEDYLDKAQSNYDKMYSRAKQQFGTLIWKQDQSNKLATNSCINCPATIAACYFAQLTGDDSYYAKALSIYSGQRKLLFSPSDGHVFDSRAWKSDGTMESSFNAWASTYNQGTMLGAAIMLYEYTKDDTYKMDAERIYNYTVKNLCDADSIVKVCQTINGDLCGFKGILMRYIRHYGQELRHEDAMRLIAKNAWKAYQNRTSKGVTWSAWLTKTDESLKRKEGNDEKNISNDAFGASTAVSAAFNAHVNGLFHKDAFSTIGAELFDDIQFMQLDDEPSDGTTPNTTQCLKNGYICFRNVDFGSQTADGLVLRANIVRSRSKLSVYLDSIAPSAKIGETTFLAKSWSDVALSTKAISGIHDVYVVCSLNNGVMFHWIKFTNAASGIGKIKAKGHKAEMSCNGDTLSVDVPDATELNIYDVSGRLAFSSRLPSGKSSIGLNRMAKGVYCAVVNVAGILSSKKLVVSR